MGENIAILGRIPLIDIQTIEKMMETTHAWIVEQIYELHDD